jgi:hypothetical protein
MHHRTGQLLRQTLVFCGWALVFGLVYTQAPLYYSNQNQYFLHGLAQGGLGQLDEDWLAGTRDPTPVFSRLVAFTYRYLGEGWFYVWYFAIFGIYFASMTGLFDTIAGERNSPRRRLAFIVLFLAVHAAALRLFCARLVGTDYLWYLQAGVAGQYLLGPGLQPSTFGVLLVLSLYLFASDRPIAAGFCAGLAGFMHSTYLLGGASLVLAYQFVLWRERRRWEAVLAGTVALVVVLPVLGYNWANFRPTTAELFQQAQELLVHARVPHHAVPGKWFTTVSAVQLAWFVLALWLVRRSRLLPVLAVPALIGLALALIQLASGNPTLALLFPWRISAVLVPVATTVILGRLVLAVAWRMAQSPSRPVADLRLVGWSAIAGLAVAGLLISGLGLGYRQSHVEDAAMTFVRDHAARGQTWLVPVLAPDFSEPSLPNVSSDFRPAPAITEKRIVPLEMQRFRLFTGVPILVDFKAIPYQDEEVLEWWRRLRFAQDFQEGRLPKEQALRRLADYGITHIVSRHDIAWPELKLLYRDDSYRVYHIIQ